MGDDLDQSIMDIFPYEEARDAQVEGMEHLDEIADINGFLTLEGACGTGKTMLALAPLINQVRSDNTEYNRILVITSVKQQLRAFENAVQDINEHSSVDTVSSLTLTGKADIYPYVRTGEVDYGDVYRVSEELRDTTRELIDEGGGDDLKDKISFAKELYENAFEQGGDYPYSDSIPTFETDSGEVEYSPYYAKHLAGVYSEEIDNDKYNDAIVPFDPQSEGTLSPDKLLELSAKDYGTSPHAVMRELLTEVDVLIGNYYHVFDQKTTSRMTEEVLSDDTLLVVDEAHNLVPRVRDLLGTTVEFSGLEQASNELEEVIGWITGDINQTDAASSTATDIFQGAEDVSLEDMQEVLRFINDLDARIGKRIGKYIDNNVYGDEGEMPLRDPEKRQQDKISQWISLSSYSTGTAKKAREMTRLAYFIRSEVYEQHYGFTRLPETSLKQVGDLLHDWVTEDHSTYFREVEFEKNSSEVDDPSHDWQNNYTATLALKNCIPKDKIAGKLDKFGAGILMSATLQPFDVFWEITGLSKLKNNGRPVSQREYGLPFPPENRRSYIANTKSYTSTNRGSPTDRRGYPSLDNKVRETYSNLILDVVETTPGNVLVAMPNYDEAEWAGKIIERDSSVKANDVLIDKSSSDWETEKMKQKFFEGGKKVMVTGAHGTLVEGVDYPGDKLNAVVVCGVPLPNTYEPYQKAVRTAYEDWFGEDNGFDYAFALPAVYKARQSIGRVIRSNEDTGVRVLADERYAKDGMYSSVRHLFPDREKEEFEIESPEDTRSELIDFWD